MKTKLTRVHLSKLLPEQAKLYGDRAALSYRDYDADCWKDISWNEFAQQAEQAARSLIALGVKPQEKIAVFSQNKPENLFVAFGAYAIGAVIIPFYATSSVSQVAYMMNDADVRLLFVGEQSQYDTALDALPHCQTAEHVFVFDPKVKRRDDDHLSVGFDQFLSMGTEAADAEIAQRRQSAQFGDTADILYTSGTTGQSKGVILTYEMYHEGILRTTESFTHFDMDDVVLSFLPTTHIFERAWGYLTLCAGAKYVINLKPHDITRTLREVRPTCMAAVPRFWEKVYQGVLEKIKSAPIWQRKLMQNALNVGMRYWEEYGSKGLTAPLAMRLKYEAYNRTIYRLLRKTIGLDRANFFPTAGAAVSPEVEKFTHAVGIYMMVGYGLTESTATVSNDHPAEPTSIGSVGRLINGLEIKFGADNEILLRGKTITPGYYRKPEATKAAIDDEGWFHTGDAGYLENGQLYLLERLKDLFKTSNGKYVAPQMIEAKLSLDPFIDQCVIVADKRKFVSALIVPDYKALADYAKTHHIAATSNEELCQSKEIEQMLHERIDLLQQDLASYVKVKHFLLLSEPFTIENGEITNTLKVRRHVVYQRYAELIDKLYADAEANYKQ